MKWDLAALLAGARAATVGHSNTPSVVHLKSMLSEFKSWKKWYETHALEYRIRAAKLKLIGDKEADREVSCCHTAERDAACCDVGVRVLEWAIKEIESKS